MYIYETILLDRIFLYLVHELASDVAIVIFFFFLTIVTLLTTYTSFCTKQYVEINLFVPIVYLTISLCRDTAYEASSNYDAI